MSTKGLHRDGCHGLTGGSCWGLRSIHYINMWVDCKVMRLFGRVSRGLLRNMISILGCPKRKGSGWKWQETVTPRVYGCSWVLVECWQPECAQTRSKEPDSPWSLTVISFLMIWEPPTCALPRGPLCVGFWKDKVSKSQEKLPWNRKVWPLKSPQSSFHRLVKEDRLHDVKKWNFKQTMKISDFLVIKLSFRASEMTQWA